MSRPSWGACSAGSFFFSVWLSSRAYASFPEAFASRYPFACYAQKYYQGDSSLSPFLVCSHLLIAASSAAQKGACITRWRPEESALKALVFSLNTLGARRERG